MSTTMRVTHHLAGDVETVFALVTDPAFLERKFTAAGAKDVEVSAEQTPNGGTTLVINRRVTLDLPGFAAKFIQPTNMFVQTENWEPATDDGRRVCTYQVDVQGVPSHIAGTVTLSPEGGQTRQDIEAEMKVSIPLVGGRLEKVAVENGTTLLRNEAEFTNRELATR
jgi:uncharacterized protein YndB with AHSA1/START domain